MMKEAGTTTKRHNEWDLKRFWQIVKELRTEWKHGQDVEGCCEKNMYQGYEEIVWIREKIKL